eukprot:9496096-Pyramimonas_sp.AAC.1
MDAWREAQTSDAGFLFLGYYCQWDVSASCTWPPTSSFTHARTRLHSDPPYSNSLTLRLTHTQAHSRQSYPVSL